MNLKLFFLTIYSSIFTDAKRWVIIIATPTTKVLPNQNVTSPCKASQPFCVESKKGKSCRLQCKLLHFHIRGKQPILFTLNFIKSPSSKDDSNESRNLSLIIHPSIPINANATNFITVYINVILSKKLASSCFWIIWN